MVVANKDCVLDAPKVVSLILKENTIFTKFKVAGDVVGPMNPRLSWGFLLWNSKLVECRPLLVS